MTVTPCGTQLTWRSSAPRTNASAQRIQIRITELTDRPEPDLVREAARRCWAGSQHRSISPWEDGVRECSRRDDVVGRVRPPPSRLRLPTALRLWAPLLHSRSPPQGLSFFLPSSLCEPQKILSECIIKFLTLSKGTGASSGWCGADPEANARGGGGKLPSIHCRSRFVACHSGGSFCHR